ncbi:MAG: ATP-binding protein, partial [Gammaproteobacteria bacterium]
WVADEATVGRDEGRLVALSIDGAAPPLGFRQFQAADFSGWQGGSDEPPFCSLAAALQRLVPQPTGAVRGVAVRRGNLPRRLESLIGRQRELQQIAESLDASPLVTLTGPGGIGKTRLAIEAAWQASGRHEDGVWLVELAPVSDAATTVSVIARGIGLEGRVSEVDDLVEQLRSWRAVVVLDNCEHLIDAVSALVERVLQRCEGVRFLLTSQEILGVEGERVLRLRSLGEEESESLFLRRARSVDDDFAPVGEDLLAVRRICTTLDGVPLAIEMAAARASTFGCRALLAGLDDRFRVLSGGRRTALPRQRTLQATLDWSHGLLRPDEATVFRRLALFVGGFKLDAACAVASDTALDRTAVAEALASLTAKSLVSVDRSGAVAHYRLLETMRAYSQQKLAEAGETAAWQRRHAEHYAVANHRALEDYLGSAMSDREFADRYVIELGNVDRAIDWALGPDGDTELAAVLVGDCLPLMMVGGRYGEVTELQARVLPMSASLSDEAVWRVRAGNAFSGFAWGAISGDQVAEAERAVAGSRRWATRAIAMIARGLAAAIAGDVATVRRCESAVIELGEGPRFRLQFWSLWPMLLVDRHRCSIGRAEIEARTDTLVDGSRATGCGTFEFHALSAGVSRHLPWESDYLTARDRAFGLLEEGLLLCFARTSVAALVSLTNRTLLECAKAGDAIGNTRLPVLIGRIHRAAGNMLPVSCGPGLAACALYDSRPEDAARLWAAASTARVTVAIAANVDPGLGDRIIAAVGADRYEALRRSTVPHALDIDTALRLGFGVHHRG